MYKQRVNDETFIVIKHLVLSGDIEGVKYYLDRLELNYDKLDMLYKCTNKKEIKDLIMRKIRDREK